MSIRRTRLSFESDFTQIPNHWLRDARLSRKARGLLAEIMSHSAGWNITVEHLIRNGTEGREAIRAAIRELESFGYLERLRNRQEDGKLAGSEYILTNPPRDGFPDSRFTPTSDNTYVGEPVHKEDYLFKEDHKNQEDSLSGVAIAPSRPEVISLCNLLADLIEGNGSKRPTISKHWLNSCRLMLDRDNRHPEDVARVMRWCQEDSFWQTNIMSMPKFREKYDQLRIKSNLTVTKAFNPNDWMNQR